MILGGGYATLGAARNLAEYGIKVCVLGPATSVARFSRSVSQFSRWPRKLNGEGLPDYLVKIAEKYRMRGWVLFPCCDEHLRILSQHRMQLSEYYVLTTPQWETVRFLYDKRLTYALAREAGVAIPRSYVPGSADRLAFLDADFPVVLKPAMTPRFMDITDRKAYRADNRQELLSLYETMSQIIGPSEVIVQDFLPEPSKNLFSFSGYFRKGEPIAGLSVKRMRQLPMDFGKYSTFVKVVEIPELRELASQLLRTIQYTGLAEVEFMWDMKQARFNLLEVNARLWAWLSLAIAAGLDLPYIAFADALGQNPSIGAIRDGTTWIRFLTDVRAAVQAIRSGKLRIWQYLTSLRNTTAFAVFSPSDPIPFMVEPLLLLIGRINWLISKWGASLFRWPASCRKKTGDYVKQKI